MLLKLRAISSTLLQLVFTCLPSPFHQSYPQLVNRGTDSLQTNDRVQECLINAKQARKAVVRYIQVRPHVATLS